jgi:hypothetical protein
MNGRRKNKIKTINDELAKPHSNRAKLSSTSIEFHSGGGEKSLIFSHIQCVQHDYDGTEHAQEDLSLVGCRKNNLIRGSKKKKMYIISHQIIKNKVCSLLLWARHSVLQNHMYPENPWKECHRAETERNRQRNEGEGGKMDFD